MTNTTIPLSRDLRENITKLRRLLPAEDITFFPFDLKDGTNCMLVYTDGMADKQLMGELIVRPLQDISTPFDLKKLQHAIPMPELKTETELTNAKNFILGGDAVLLIDGWNFALRAGVKATPMRAVAEPPTDMTVKGPRAGFVEEVKINMVLLRTRLASEALRFETVTVGKRSNSKVVVCYLDGIAKKEIVNNVKARLKKIDIDTVCDSSYVSDFLAEKKFSLFRQVGNTEKPDILAAKLSEGRVGILVDGSPIALTVPYLLVEDFQAPDDYFVSAYRATFTRFLRVFSLLFAIYLPALYVAAQLFKLQLLPIGLLLNIASNIQGISLSPSLEMLLTLLVLEVLTEASIRMPKYVGLALSVVGALVLGDTAVNAGFLSTPAIMIVALSGICLYTVPDLVETTSILRLIMLLVAGSIGVYGVLLFTAFIFYYLFSTESYGTPILSPISPVDRDDLKDSLVKYHLRHLPDRPRVLQVKNKRRLKVND